MSTIFLVMSMRYPCGDILLHRSQFAISPRRLSLNFARFYLNKRVHAELFAFWQTPRTSGAALSVVLFMQCGAAVREYEFLEKEPIETEHGVTALVRERRAAFAPEYDRANRIGAALCILAAVPLFAAVMVGVSFLMSMSICLLLVLVACGVYAFVRVGTVQDAMDRLLEDGDFTRGHKAVKGRLTALTAAYWLVVVAIFLWYTFGPNGNGQPQYSWFIWAIAGVVFAAVMVVMKAAQRKKQ